jgi:hypothetical protein
VVLGEVGDAGEMRSATNPEALWLGHSDEQLVGITATRSELGIPTASWTARSSRLVVEIAPLVNSVCVTSSAEVGVEVPGGGSRKPVGTMQLGTHRDATELGAAGPLTRRS